MGINAASAFTEDFLNFQIAGVTKFKIDKDGNYTGAGSSVSTGNISTSGNISTTGTGTITSNGQLTANSGTASRSPTTGSLVVNGGAGISGALNVGTNITANGNISASTGGAFVRSVSGMGKDGNLVLRPDGQVVVHGTKGLRLDDQTVQNYGYMMSIGNNHMTQNTEINGGVWRAIKAGKTSRIQTNLVAGADQLFAVVGSDNVYAAGDATVDNFMMIVKTNGNVGIGTITPSYKLDVQGGDINASGSVRAAGVALTSDIRFKKDIQTLDFSLEKLLSLRGVSYHWKQNEFPEHNLMTVTKLV